MRAIVPTLKSLYLDAVNGTAARVVTGPHSRWLETPEEDRVVTEEAAQFAKDVFLGKFKHRRSGRFSPSSIGKCGRRSLFGFAGAPQLGVDLDAIGLMSIGTQDHLYWQVEGLSVGWMLDAEVWTWDPHYRIGGSIDGLLHDWSLFELKTVIGGKYSRIVSIDDEPDYEHRLQFQAYKHTEGVETGSIVYQERATGQFHEFRVEAEDALEKDLIGKLEELNNHVEDRTLPPMLNDCEMRSGAVYRSCPYRKYCRTANTLTIHTAEDAA
jgi:hypothetical protein